MKKHLPLCVLVATFTLAGMPMRAEAQGPTAAAVEEARPHYKRGVDLYGEANYQAALIEFRRAYEIAPNYSVLYNIGQIHYQLHDYAAALKTFQSYLQEGGSKVTGARRADVEQQVVYLRDRVGYLDLTSNAEGADIVVDGTVVGRTPSAQPIIVTVGRRRVELVRNDRVLAVRTLEVAAGDKVKVELNEAQNAAPTAAAKDAAPRDTTAATSTSGLGTGGLSQEAPKGRGAVPAALWITTGALAVGTGVVGIMALGAASDLKTKRETDGVRRSDLESAQSKTKTLALVTDILGIATVLGIGTATYFSLTPGTQKAENSPVQVQVGLGSVSLKGAF